MPGEWRKAGAAAPAIFSAGTGVGRSLRIGPAMTENRKRRVDLKVAAGVLMAFAVLMYVSVMYKIVAFGP